MRPRPSVASVHAALLAALGLPLAACGGQSFARSPTDGDGGSAADGGTSEPDGGTSEPDATPPGPDGSVPFPDGAAGFPFACIDPVPVIVGGKDTGFDTCQGGVLRRRAVKTCPSLLPRPPQAACASDAGVTGQCTQDSDCTAGPNGACGPGGFLGPGGCYCSYGCAKDADCGGGEICVCGDPIGRCEPATCTSGASCAPGAECADYSSAPGCPAKAFACQTHGDQCFADSDCADGGSASLSAQCTVTSGVRVCTPPQCAVGRPFLVQGEARLAPTTARRDWRGAVTPKTEGLSPEMRARLAAEWARVGQMEHASVAAFARFALQLLAVGAPPHLLEATQRAMGDETVHAKLAFGLASAYGGGDVGPGALAIDACLDACDLQELLTTVILEGCIGETVAAVEAREALDHARDPEVRAVLETIVRDETAHAELAWRTVAWALEARGAEVRPWVEAVFAEATWPDGSGAVADRAEEDLLAHGVVGGGLRAELRVAAIREAVLPCARALLAPRAPEGERRDRNQRETGRGGVESR